MSKSSFDEAEITRRRSVIEWLKLGELHEFLMQPKPRGQGWLLEQVLEAERWYRRFLILKLMFPDQNIIPHPAIDAVWHAHIALDTRMYRRDCEAIFGDFLHHDPSDGHQMSKDMVDLWYERTQGHFRDVFGEDYSKISIQE